MKSDDIIGLEILAVPLGKMWQLEMMNKTDSLEVAIWPDPPRCAWCGEKFVLEGKYWVHECLHEERWHDGTA